MADTIPPVLIELQLETAKIASQMQQLQGNFAQFGATVEKQTSFLSKFKATASGVFAGNLMVTGLNAIKGAMAGAIQDAQEYEKVTAQLKAGIESTGNVAGLSVAQLKENASALEKLSSVDENLIIQSQAVFQTFTNIRNVAGKNNDIFNQASVAALDLSVKMGGDLQGATVQLGKALNDPIKGITALTRVGVVFTDQQKAQIKALVESGDVMGAQKIILAEMKTEFGGAAKAAGDTFAGAVFRAKDKVGDFSRDLITNLQPILLKVGKTIGDLYTKYLAPLFSWLGKNKEAIAAMAAVILTAVAAIKIYNAILLVSKAVQTAYAVAQVLMKGGQLASIASTNGLAASMLRLNAIMAANPIGLIVAGIALLAAGFVIAWNHSETFRKVVVKGLQIVLNGVGYLVGAIAKMIGLFAKIPGMGWAKGIADGASKAANDIRKVSDGLDGLANKKISIPGFGGGKNEDAGSGGGGGASAPGGGGGLTKDQIKAAKAAAKQRAKDIEAANKDIAKNFDKMNEAIDEGNKKAAEALKQRDKANATAKAKYAELEIDLTKKRNDAIAKIEADYAKRKAGIESDYAKRKLELNKAAEDKITEMQLAASEKQAGIVQQSIDRLRSAFASGTAASIGEMFKNGAKSADDLISQLKNKLTAAKELQANAAALAGAGYSQVFIEEVVKQGPEVGNEMAKALLGANQDTQTELKKLYGEVTDISTNGLNDIAKSMNQGGKLATQELIDAYNKVPEELTKAIAGVHKDLSDALADANSQYLEKLADAAVARDEALTDARLKFQEDLANAAKDLADKLAQIQQDYEDKIAEIVAATKEKLASLRDDIAKTIEALKALGAAGAAAAAAKKLLEAPVEGNPNPNPGYIVPIPLADANKKITTADNKGFGITINQVNHNTTADANTTLVATLSAIKYGYAGAGLYSGTTGVI